MNPYFTLANKITVLRILTIPVIVIFLINGHAKLSLVLFGLSALTDLLDGLAARLKREQTQLGAFLDPMADKLLLTSVYLTMALTKMIPMWIFVVVFSRDLLIVLGWSIIHILTGSSVIAPRAVGKIATGIQMVAALTFIAPASPLIQKIFIWALVIVTTVSVVDYTLAGEKKLGQWG